MKVLIANREEVSEFAVEKLLQLSFTEFVFVSLAPGVVVKDGDERIHGSLQFTGHYCCRAPVEQTGACSFQTDTFFLDMAECQY